MGKWIKVEPCIWRKDTGEYQIVARLRINDRFLQKQDTITDGTKEKARIILARLKKELRDGKDSFRSASSMELKTFADLLKIYKDRHAQASVAHLKKVDQVEKALGVIDLPFFADRFERYMLLLRTTNSKITGKPLSNVALNRTLQIVKAVFNMALALGLIQNNPITKVRFPKFKETPRDVILQPLDRQRLINTVAKEAPHLSAIVNFALQVPCRKTELINMKKDDLDLINKAIRVKAQNSKNNRGCWKPIPPDMIEYFQTLPAETEYLFYRIDQFGKHVGLGDFHGAWGRCLKIAGIKGFHFHDTRHMAATMLVDNGTPEQVVMSVANWKTNMLKNYYHREPKKTLQLVCFSSQQQTIDLKKVMNG